MRLRRKIDQYLIDWKNDSNRLPLIIKGAKYVGKTNAILNFANNNYENVININFALEPWYKTIFDNGFNVNTIIHNISIINNDFVFTPGKTLIFLMRYRIVLIVLLHLRHLI